MAIETSYLRPDRVHPQIEPASGAHTKDSLVEEAYRTLKASILDGTLPAGYQAVEQRVAEQLKMSRTPVHEAVIRLQHEGLLRVLPRRGVQVLPVSALDMRETYKVLIALEGMAGLLLAEQGDRASDAGRVVAEMKRATDRMEAALLAHDLKTWAEQDDHFHRLLVTECGNARLAAVARTMTDQAQRARAATLRLRPVPSLFRSVDEHRHILAALGLGNGLAAREAVEAHRSRASREIIAALTGF